MTFKIHPCKAVPEENWGLMLQHDGICSYCGEDLEKEQLLSQLAAVTAERDEARTALHQAKQLNEADNAALKKAWDELKRTVTEHAAEWEAICDENHRADKLQTERDAALARVAVLEGALKAIADDGWIEGQKTRGPFKGMEVEQIAAAALSQSISEALAAVRMAQLVIADSITQHSDDCDCWYHLALKALTDAFGEGEGA